MKDEKPNISMTINDDEIHDLASLFCEDIYRYKSLGGDMHNLSANNVYDTINNRHLLLNTGYDCNEMIQFVESKLNSRDSLLLDELEMFIDNHFDITILTGAEIVYLITKSGIKFPKRRKRFIHLPIQDRARLFIEYIKMLNSIMTKLRRNDLAEGEFNDIYALYNNKEVDNNGKN